MAGDLSRPENLEAGAKLPETNSCCETGIFPWGRWETPLQTKRWRSSKIVGPISLQSYGDDPTRFHPHLHSLVTDGLVSADGSLIPVPCPDPVCLMELFRHKLIKGLLGREKISPRLVEIMQNWVHPGFSVFQGERIDPDDHQGRRRLAGYMVHPPIALERLRYRPETGQLIYYGRPCGCGADAEASAARIFPALDFLAGLCGRRSLWCGGRQN